MNLPLLIVCIGLGIAGYWAVVTLLDLVFKDEPKARPKPVCTNPACQKVIAISKDAAETRQRMAAIATNYRRSIRARV